MTAVVGERAAEGVVEERVGAAAVELELLDARGQRAQVTEDGIAGGPRARERAHRAALVELERGGAERHRGDHERERGRRDPPEVDEASDDGRGVDADEREVDARL